MDNSEKIQKLLKYVFSHVYCDTCSSNETSEDCEYCHRKYMNWSISDNTATAVSEEILETLGMLDD